MTNVQTNGSTSSSLLGRVRQQDPGAWIQLTDLYGPVVYQWARNGGLQSSDAADVSQEVFRTVCTRVEMFRRDRSGYSFRGWLWGITRNKLREHFRRRAGQPQGAGGTDAHQRFAELADSLPDDSSQFEPADVRADLMQRTLQMLRDEFEDSSWQAFFRMVVQNDSATDIARDLGMTAKAVRQAKFRVLRRLRQELEELL
jgi:RNA polymerase sigma-70 factor (ECF subfamily)